MPLTRSRPPTRKSNSRSVSFHCSGGPANQRALCIPVGEGVEHAGGRTLEGPLDDKSRVGCCTHGHDARGFSHTTIHGVPNLSTHIPNLTAKNVSPSGMR